MPRTGCGLNEVEDECPFPCPAANDQCPALEPLPAHECPPKEASMVDCVGYDCRFGSVHKSNSRDASLNHDLHRLTD